MKSMSNYMTMNIQICYFINLFKLTRFIKPVNEYITSFTYVCRIRY